MEPILTLYERDPVSADTLPPVLAHHYGGGLRLPQEAVKGRPYVIANFVETLDGVVAYNAPEHTGGGEISGNNKQDQMVMGILRAEADAVIFGANSLRKDANHLHIPSFIFPAFAHEYEMLRAQLHKMEAQPMSVVMTGSGDIDLADASFHTPGLRTLIVTTARGAAVLSQKQLPAGTEVRVVRGRGESGEPDPQETLALLGHEYDVRLALYEGGPTLLASFLMAGLVDELFLTLAPQIAGRAPGQDRLALVEGVAFTPQEAHWITLLSTKLAGSYLLLRYGFSKQ